MPAKAGIQYATALVIESLTLWNTGSPPARGRRTVVGGKFMLSLPESNNPGGRLDQIDLVSSAQKGPLARGVRPALARCARADVPRSARFARLCGLHRRR